MNPGKLRERAMIMRLETNGTDTVWKAASAVWLSAKETGRQNIFSKVGVGAAGAEFLLRRCSLTLDDAILWRGQHYFLTDIQQEGFAPAYYRVQAARITPETAVAWQKSTAASYNRPIADPVRLGSFPVCLTEKYRGSADAESHIESTTRLIAVAPKAAEFDPGKILEILGREYRIMVVHDLEPHKIEYEIERTEDD